MFRASAQGLSRYRRCLWLLLRDRRFRSQSAAITCVKPSGTVSQLVDSASGIHTRHSPYYIRRVRGDKKDPLSTFMINAGIPAEDCVMRPESTVVFSFPQKSPKGARTRDDLDAIKHLELWMQYQRHWCEHKPSVTISVKEDEWMDSIDEAVELDVPVKSLTPTFADVQLLEATENSEGESINANLDNLPQEANDFDFDFSEEEDDDSSFF